MPDIKLFDGGRFISTTVSSENVGDLKKELAAGNNGFVLSENATLSVNGVTDLSDRKAVRDNDMVAGVNADKTGGK
jgi:hypothetical protein|tara:strand:+ start:307 stop:534 length:228 start_codon:yes stop_codon:yes gene_type:complete